jgi:hypothetical protein
VIACPPLPAEPATRVPVAHHRVQVCVRGQPVVLGRGPVRRASAAGNRVAWLETRGDRVVIRVVRVGKRVTPVRRIVRRVHRPEAFGLVLTRAGDLAWLASTDDRRGEVGLQRPGRRIRVLDRYAAVTLELEDGRTLRWRDPAGFHQFFDLRRARCPARSRFTPVLRTDRVLITRRRYAATTLLRGCDLATGRDVVVGEREREDTELDVIGVDRTWVLLRSTRIDAPNPEIATSDVATGDQKAWSELIETPSPRAGAFAVTDRGIPVWVAGDRLLALRNYGVSELDRGGTVAGLHAEGDAVVWTHDGAPRTAVPAW